MSTDEKQICLYCKWWKPTYDVYDALVPSRQAGEHSDGECRISNPVISQWGSYSEGLSSTTVWPHVKGGDFCGKFENRRDDHTPRGFDNWKTVCEALPEFKAPVDD